jgi:hypothetical protein
VESFASQINESLRNRTHFFPYGLAGWDILESDPKMYALDTLMKMNGP